MTTWNKNWNEQQKAEARELRRRKYALKRLKEGKSYRRLSAPLKAQAEESQIEVPTEVKKALAERIRRRLLEE